MLKKFLGDSTLYILASLVNRGIAFLLLPIYTRYLSPSDYGIIAVCVATYSALGPMFTLNLSAAVNIFYFKLEATEFKRLLASVALWYLTVPLLLAGVLEIAGAFSAINISPAVPFYPYLRLAVWIAVLNAALDLPLALYFAEQKAAKYALLTVAGFLGATLLLLYFVAVRQGGALGSLQAQALAGGLTSLVSYTIIVRRFDSLKELRVSFGHLREALHLSFPTVFHSLCLWGVNLSDRWILGKFVDSTQIGLYNLAYTFGMIVSIIGVALCTAFTPFYYKNYEDELFRARLPKLLTLYFMIISLTTFAVSLFAREIVQVVTAPAYHSAWRLIPVIAAAYWVQSGFYLLSLNVIQNARKTKWIVALTAPSAAVNILLNLLFVPVWGVWAAAVNTLLAFSLMATLGIIVSRRFDKLPFPWLKIAHVVLIALVGYLIGNLFLVFDSFLLSVVVKALLFLTVLAAMPLIAGFGVGDAKRILRAARPI